VKDRIGFADGGVLVGKSYEMFGNASRVHGVSGKDAHRSKLVRGNSIVCSVIQLK
jgi:hypothetical protein